MFTGLIEQVGEIDGVRQTSAGRELRVRASFSDLKTGESIAVNGACLTVREVGTGWSDVVDGVSLTVNELKPGGLQLSLIEYTLRHTTLGDLKPGTRVHVEADVIAKHVRRLLEPYMREASALDSLADFSLEH